MSPSLQLACLQLNDALSFRFHWPLNTNLEVNGVQYRVYSRNNTQKLGANGRDEPANISTLCAPGGSWVLLLGNGAERRGQLSERELSGDLW